MKVHKIKHINVKQVINRKHKMFYKKKQDLKKSYSLKVI